MRIDYMTLSECLAMRHRDNPKAHDLDEINDSIARFGFVSPPLIDEATKTMTAGHGRCEALERRRLAGMVPPDRIEVRQGVWYVPVIRGISFKSERERDAYLLADNKLSEAGGWDDQILYKMLSEFTEDEFEGLGFTDDELDELLAPNEDSDGKDVDVDGHVRTIGAVHKVRPPLQMSHDDWTLHLGDCLEGLRKLEDNSVDALVTDPPGGAAFMNAEWDRDKGGRTKWIAWLAEIMREGLRVLKPGAHGIAWAFPRTQHWTMTALEDAGFEIRDCCYHAHGQGFPKSLDVSKAIYAKLGAERAVIIDAKDRRDDGTTYAIGHTGKITSSEPNTAAAASFSGFQTALKPSIEPWILVRKPIDGTIAENALAHGTGGLNIGATRVGDELRHNPSASSMYSMGEKPMEDAGGTNALGRWPSHFVISHLAECTEVEHENADPTWSCADGCAVAILESQQPGTSRFFYTPKPSRSEAEAGLDELEASSGGEATNREDDSAGLRSPRAGAGRLGGRKNTHPTRKSIALMRWFVRLVTPPRRDDYTPTILDPFAGSGTTGLAALVEGFRFLGFEQSPEYHQIAVARLRSIIDDPRQVMDMDNSELPAEGNER